MYPVSRHRLKGSCSLEKNSENFVENRRFGVRSWDVLASIQWFPRRSDFLNRSKSVITRFHVQRQVACSRNGYSTIPLFIRTSSRTMSVQPRSVICVLGRWDSFAPVQSIVDNVSPGFTLDLDYSQLEPDERMKDAFKASLDRSHPTIYGGEWRTMDSHTSVAYVLSPPMKKSESESISATALLLIAELLKKGGVAAKSESAGLAHGRDHWLELARRYRKATKDGDAHAASATLYRAWVQRVVHDEDTNSFYSVGMHLLGHRDAEVDDDLEIPEAVKWIDLMGLYLVADKPKRALRNGEGFRFSPSEPRRIIELVDCNRYAEDDFFFNPYGYVRLIKDD